MAIGNHFTTLYSAIKSQHVAVQFKQFNTLYIISEMLTVLYHTAPSLYSTVLYYCNKKLGIQLTLSVKKRFVTLLDHKDHQITCEVAPPPLPPQTPTYADHTIDIR